MGWTRCVQETPNFLVKLIEPGGLNTDEWGYLMGLVARERKGIYSDVDHAAIRTGIY